MIERDALVLTLNGGSSSLKVALFEASATRIASGAVDRIGAEGARLTWNGASEACDAPDHASALDAILSRANAGGALARVAVVAHRIVHGGPRLRASCLVDDDVLAELRRVAALDPNHMPAEIAIVEAMAPPRAGAPRGRGFDTAFHADMPRVAQLLALPFEYEARGLRRYGFHGLSYTFLMEELARVAGPDAARGRIVLAHLGAGSSLGRAEGGQGRRHDDGLHADVGRHDGDAHRRSRSRRARLPDARRRARRRRRRRALTGAPGCSACRA